MMKLFSRSDLLKLNKSSFKENYSWLSFWRAKVGKGYLSLYWKVWRYHLTSFIQGQASRFEMFWNHFILNYYNAQSLYIFFSGSENRQFMKSEQSITGKSNKYSRAAKLTSLLLATAGSPSAVNIVSQWIGQFWLIFFTFWFKQRTF